MADEARRSTTVHDLLGWMRGEITRFGRLEKTAIITFDAFEQAGYYPGQRIKALIFTDKNRYSITAHDELRADPADGRSECNPRRSYLGCIASSRKPRAGEDWTRGRDLADGPLSYATWHRILADILSYEMVELSSEAHRRQLFETPSSEAQETVEESLGAANIAPMMGEH